MGLEGSQGKWWSGGPAGTQQGSGGPWKDAGTCSETGATEDAEQRSDLFGYVSKDHSGWDAGRPGRFALNVDRKPGLAHGRSTQAC